MHTRSRALALLLSLPLAATSLTLATALPAAAEDTVAFYDTFEGSTLDTSKWLYTLGTAYEGGPAAFGTGEIETNTDSPDNVSVHDGSLYITPVRDSSGAWTSARIESVRSDFKPADGSTMTTEFRAALPDVTEENGSGYWPALWMNGSPYRQDRWSWPAGGEFDIGESVSGGQWSNSVLHCGYKAQWGGPCNEPSGINAGSVPLPGAWGSFNDYSFQWDRTDPANEQLRWYHNDTLTQTVSESDLPADVWASLSEHEGYYIIMNVAIDGAYPAAQGKLTNASTVSGRPMRVASVQVSYTQGSAPAPTSPAPTEPTAPSSTPTETPAPTTTPEDPAPSTSTSTPTPTTEAPEPSSTPAPSTGLRTTALTSGSVTLTWDAVPGATSYELLRAGIPIPFLEQPSAQAPVLTTTATTATNDGLLPGTPYIYSVRADNGTTTPEITVTTP